MGLPVITTDALGCVDAVKNGETGYIVPVGDAAKLLEIMDTLYYDGDLRAKLGNNARNFVLRRFNSHDVNSAFDDFVQNLCIKRGRFAARRIAIVTTVPATLYHLFSNQIDRIKREGFNVFLISSAGDQWICAKDVENKYGIKVHCVPFLRTFSLFSDMYTIIALCSLLAKLHLNVIYYCTPKASLLTAIAAFFMRVPFRIYSLFGQVYYGKKGLMKNILFLAEFLTCSFSHRVILMSKSNLAYIQKEKLCAPRKMGLLGKGTNQGVDAKGRFNPDSIDARNVDCLRNRLNIPENMVVFGYMGRLVKDKGIRELFNAWKDIRKETLQCTLLLIGPKKEPRDKLPDTLFDSIANDSRIRLIEPVTDPEMYYALMNILILPSYREGFPNVVLEAAAMRLPVITTDAIGCIDSVIENETGFIVPFKNIEKLKEKMKVLLHNPQLRAEMGFKARERVLKDFNAEKITEELIYLINNKEFCARVKSV
jgi:glycosyltransferase involved in cell wall biosynthesis